MAQDITIAGAQYEDCPAIDIAKTGGGVARFVDTSDADATADDILFGRVAYVNGQRVVGTGGGVKWASCDFDWQTKTVSNFSMTFSQAAALLSSGSDIKLTISIHLAGGAILDFVGNLNFKPNDIVVNTILWDCNVMANFDDPQAVTVPLYYVRLSLYNNENIVLDYREIQTVQ